MSRYSLVHTYKAGTLLSGFLSISDRLPCLQVSLGLSSAPLYFPLQEAMAAAISVIVSSLSGRELGQGFASVALIFQRQRDQSARIPDRGVGIETLFVCPSSLSSFLFVHPQS